MDWRTALTELLDLSLPVTAAIAAQPHLTLANAWDHPAVKIVRERLMSYLGKPSTIAELSEASEQLRTLHEELLRKDKLTMNDLAVPVPSIFNSELVKKNATAADPWGLAWTRNNTAGGGAYTHCW